MTTTEGSYDARALNAAEAAWWAGFIADEACDADTGRERRLRLMRSALDAYFAAAASQNITAADPGRRAEDGVTSFLLPSAIGHLGNVLPPALARPIESLLRNVMYYRDELAGSWIDAAGELAQEILSIEPGMPHWTAAPAPRDTTPVADALLTLVSLANDAAASEGLSWDAVWKSAWTEGREALAASAADGVHLANVFLAGEVSRLRAGLRELVESLERTAAALQNLIEESPDPGTEALGAVHEARQIVLSHTRAVLAGQPNPKPTDDKPTQPNRNHALNVIAAALSDLHGWLRLSTRYAAAEAAMAVVNEREFGVARARVLAGQPNTGQPTTTDDAAVPYEPNHDDSPAGRAADALGAALRSVTLRPDFTRSGSLMYQLGLLAVEAAARTSRPVDDAAIERVAAMLDDRWRSCTLGPLPGVTATGLPYWRGVARAVLDAAQRPAETDTGETDG